LKVVILCGGKGTRIRDVSGDIPKPMVRIGEQPILTHIMDIYTAHGHEDFILCLGYRGWDIKEYFLNLPAELQDIVIDYANGQTVDYRADRSLPPWRVVLANTGLDSNTGYRIRSIRRYVADETFLLTYGDGVGNVDITRLVEFHKSHGKYMTVTAVHPPSRFGELVIEDNLVTEFEEKPQTKAGYINGGFFVCEPEVFDYLPDDVTCSLEREPLSRLAKDGQLATYTHSGFWMPMDTAREYNQLNELWRSGNPPWVAAPSS
jgi:glucose-1-phosphate cytidylyltransferase